MKGPAVLLLAATTVAGEGNWKAPPAEKARANPIASTPEALRRGKFLYQKNCVRCHGEKGKGDGPNAKSGPADPKDLTDRELQTELTDGEMFWKITKGWKDGKEVIMPAFEREIRSAEDRWKVVLFVRNLVKQGGAESHPLTPRSLRASESRFVIELGDAAPRPPEPPARSRESIPLRAPLAAPFLTCGATAP